MSSSSYVGGVGEERRDYSGLFILPAAPAQRQLWFLCQVDAASNAAYNVTSAVRLIGRLNPVLLQRALNAEVARQESLRTGVGVVDGEPRQLVVPEALVSLPIVDRTGLEPAAAEAFLQDLGQEQGAIPFTLDEPPLLRVILVREAPEQHTLIVVIHHIVCDGWSTEVFYRDLADGYQRLIEGRAAAPDPPIQYADYVAWQEQSLAGEQMRDLVTHWRGALSGVVPLPLPLDHPRRGPRRMMGARLEVSLDSADVADIDRLAARWGATRFMLLLAAFKVTLARVTGQDDVTVGTPVAGRHHPDAEALIGFFANTIVLRTRLPLRDRFSATVAAVRHTCIEAFSHQQMPFHRIVEEMLHTRVLDRNPLFDVMFSMQDAPAMRLDLPGLTMAPVELKTTSAKFEIWLTVLPAAAAGDGLLLRLDYDRDLYDTDTACRILAIYRCVLRDVRRDPEALTAGLPKASAAERARVERWSVGPPLVAPDGTILDLVRGEVSAPEAELSCAELRARATDLANRLREAGLGGPEMVVCTPPVTSAALIVIALAVFEVGAVMAYGEHHQRTGAFVRSTVDDWVLTTGPSIDLVAGVSAPLPDGPALQQAQRVCTHRELTTAIAAMADRLAITDVDDVVLLADGPPNLIDMLLPLVAARRLIIARDEAPADSVIIAAPTTWRRLLTDGWRPPSGARLVCRGEVVATDLAEILADTGHTVHIGHDTPVSAVPVGLAEPGPYLGPPLAGTTRLLLDETAAPVPLGVVGQLYFGGVPTGERYRYTHAGELEFVGYTDDRLVVGDYVVAPSRIERVLADTSGVRDAAVVPIDGRLAGWLVLENPGEEVVASVRGRARAVLAAHELPAVFGVLPELPRLPDGAVNRSALLALRSQATLGGTDNTPPRNRLERVIVAIFRDLLPIRDFGIHADFFALGGHSLLAAKVIGHLRDQEGVLVPVRDFLRRPTAAGLAQAVATHPKDPHKTTASQKRLANITDKEVEQLLRELS
jgi:non-ribosomal peptide synthetase component F